MAGHDQQLGSPAAPFWRPLAGLSELPDGFEAVLLDQFGVLHDGQKPYPGAAEACRYLARDRGMKVSCSRLLREATTVDAAASAADALGLNIYAHFLDLFCWAAAAHHLQLFATGGGCLKEPGAPGL